MVTNYYRVLYSTYTIENLSHTQKNCKRIILMHILNNILIPHIYHMILKIFNLKHQDIVMYPGDAYTFTVV